MPRPEALSSRAVSLRTAGFAVAVALGAVAIWLIVTSSSQKRLELGVLAGLWGLLLGAFSVFGSRRHEDPGAGPLGTGIGAELELRSRATEVEALGDVTTRRAEESRLQEFLRQEIREAVNREVGSLRDEITQLRTELLEKVGGQLRLEHIETTRVIGSDLEALQGEIRALKAVSRTARAGSVVDGTVVEREVVDRAVVDGPDGVRAASARWTGGHAAPAPRDDAAGTDATGPISGLPPLRRVAPAAPASTAPPPARPAAPVQESPLQPGAGRTAPARPAGPPVVPSAPVAQRPEAPAAQRSEAPAAQRSEAPAAQRPHVPGGQRPATPPVPPRGQPAGRPAQQPAPRQPAATQPAAAAQPADRQHPAAVEAPADPTQAGAPAGDPFADLPRLTPWVDDEPAQPRTRPAQPGTGTGATQPPTAPTSTPPTYVRPPAAPPVPPNYEGRRRRTEQAGAGTAKPGGVPAAERDNPGRRRRAEEGEQDSLLAELLRRERT